MDFHENKLITGGSDSKLIEWEDVTKELEEEEYKIKAEKTKEEYLLSSMIYEGKYKEAAIQAFKLKKNRDLFKVIEILLDKTKKNQVKDPIMAILDNNSVFEKQFLNSDKISASGSPDGFLNGGHWGVWFANGARELTSNTNLNNWEGQINVTPNPFNQFLQLELDIPTNAPIQLSLYNPLGQLIRQQQLQGKIGQQTIVWETHDLGAGLYVLQIEQAGQQSVIKLVK